MRVRVFWGSERREKGRLIQHAARSADYIRVPYFRKLPYFPEAPVDLHLFMKILGPLSGLLKFSQLQTSALVVVGSRPYT